LLVVVLGEIDAGAGKILVVMKANLFTLSAFS
jgi:hypothetical protein